MIAYLDCLSCLVSQTLQTARFCGASPEMQDHIMRETLVMLSKTDWRRSPMSLGAEIRRIVRDKTGIDDPYVEVKRQSNRQAERHIEALQQELEDASHPIHVALAASIAGNALDYGSKERIELSAVLDELKTRPFAIDERDALVDALANAASIGVIADNAGEIVFDRLLLETVIRVHGPKRVLFVVRDEPFINDALLADARDAGLEDLHGLELRAMSAQIPELDGGNRPLWDELMSCDVLISKGQANYEAFSAVSGIYFLLIMKCGFVAEHLAERTSKAVDIGDMVAWRSPR